MATSEQPAGSWGEPLGEFAHRTMTDLHRTIVCHEAGVLKGEVEAIHDMRVGIRRMRVGLNNFSSCMTKEEKSRLDTSLKRLAESLGKVRDLDVLIVSMNSKKRRRMAEDPHALSALVKRIKARRRRNLKTLTNFIRETDFDALKMEGSAVIVEPAITPEQDGETN